jgi:hypothetical protein
MCFSNVIHLALADRIDRINQLRYMAGRAARAGVIGPAYHLGLHDLCDRHEAAEAPGRSVAVAYIPRMEAIFSAVDRVVSFPVTIKAVQHAS